MAASSDTTSSVADLPTPLTPLLGREETVAEAMRVLHRTDVRLLTLTGSGGVGKTRVALQVAAELRDDFADGVAFVALAPLSDPEYVLPSIAQFLQLTEAPGQSWPERLADALRETHLLLVLDNFEHLLPAAPAVARLLTLCPRLTVLATSRAALRLSGEHELSVPPLAVPERGASVMPEHLRRYAGVELFCQRAQAVKPAFILTSVNAAAVADICTRLDGMPLAIELAAARVRLLSLDAIRDRLGERLQLLTGGARGLPMRQRTLRDTIAWSYDLLYPDEQRLFRQLSVFAGGWSLEAAEFVCNSDGNLDVTVLDGLASLHEKNLIGRVDLTTAEPRLAMLETMREFAMVELVAHGEAGEAQARHARYFAALAEELATGDPTDAGAAEASSRLAAEIANVRAALTWFLAQSDGTAAAQLALHIAPIWEVRGQFTEGRHWLEEVLATLTSVDHTLRAHVLKATAKFAEHQGDYAVAQPRYEEALDAFRALDDRPTVAVMLRRLAVMAYEFGDRQRARTLLDESLALSREVGDQAGIADALNYLGGLIYQAGDVQHARSLHEEALAIYRTLGDQRGIATILNRLAMQARDAGDLETAYRLQEQTVAIERHLGDVRRVAHSTFGLAMIAQFRDDPGEATALFREAIDTFRQVDDTFGLAMSLATLAIHLLMRHGRDEPAPLLRESLRLTKENGYVAGTIVCLEGLATVALVQRAPVRAARLFGAAARQRETTGQRSPAYRASYDRAIAANRRALGEDAFAAAYAEGCSLSLNEAVALALEQPQTADGTSPDHQ